MAAASRWCGKFWAVKRLFAALVLAGALSATGAASAPATTAPAYNFQIRVLVTDGGIRLDRSVAKRGWLAHFLIQNRSKQSIRFEIGGLTSKPILPGKNGKLGSFLDQRGQFSYHLESPAKKPLKNRSGLFVVE